MPNIENDDYRYWKEYQEYLEALPHKILVAGKAMNYKEFVQTKHPELLYDWELEQLEYATCCGECKTECYVEKAIRDYRKMRGYPPEE